MCLLTLVCNLIIVKSAKDKLYTDVDKVPPTEYGLLLGTTPQTRIGRRPNQFFKFRIDAAEQLYKSGKIKKILISGDENSLDGVNEVVHSWHVALTQPTSFSMARDIALSMPCGEQ